MQKHAQICVGDDALVLLPIPGNPLQAKYSGPYTIHHKVNNVDYIVNTPGCHNHQRLCHINMLKKRHYDNTTLKLCATFTAIYVQ